VPTLEVLRGMHGHVDGDYCTPEIGMAHFGGVRDVFSVKNVL
jgi:hypothetical protein